MRTVTKDGIAKQDVGFGHIVERRVFAGTQIPDDYEYGDTEGQTDEEITIERERNLVERGQVDAAAARTEVNQKPREDDHTARLSSERAASKAKAKS